MKRNLDKRVETMTPILDPRILAEIDGILDLYVRDNCTVWDCGPDGAYTRRTPAEGEPKRSVQEMLIARVRETGEAAEVSAAS